MKRITSLLLIISIFFISSYSQPIHKSCYQPNKYYYKKSNEGLKVLAIYAGSIVLNAMGDAYNDSGNKPLGHTLNAASTGLLLASPFIVKYDKNKWGYYAASYLSLRIGLFDPIYNSTRGLPIWYIGNSAPTDKLLRKTGAPEQIIMFDRSLFLIVGIHIPLTKIN